MSEKEVAVAVAEGGDADGEETTSLARSFGSKWSMCQVAALVINCAFLVYSHVGINAIVFSTIELEEPGSDGGSGGGGGGGTPTDEWAPLGVNQCINAADQAIWLGTNTDGSQDGRCDSWDIVFGIQRACPFTPDFKKAGKESALEFLYLYGFAPVTISGYDANAKLQQEWGFSSNCTGCFLKQIDETVSKCASQCIGRLQALPGCPIDEPACGECVAEEIIPKFITCSGLTDFPSESQYTYGDDCDTSFLVAAEDRCYVPSEQENLYNVFEITFGNAITKSIDGGAYFLAILVLVASGVWPYVKNIIMVVTWFVPMSGERREQLLLWLARLGRWSLVDVFAVIVIVVCLRIDKEISGGEILLVRAQSSYAIYCFTIAALWALTQGEVIRVLNRKLEKQSGKADKEPSDTEWANLPKLRAVLGLSSFVSLGLFMAGMFQDNVNITIFGVITDLAGINSYNYTGFATGLGLVDGCQTGFWGEYVLVIVFFALALLCPLIALCFNMYLAFDPMNALASGRGMVRAINAINNFSCLDVFFVSLLILIEQFEPLIAGSVGKQAEDICGDFNVDSPDGCIKYVGTIQSGAFLIGASVLFFWVAAVVSARVQAICWSKAREEGKDKKSWGVKTVEVGDEVEVLNKGRGIVRHFGNTEFAPGVWIGVELDEPNGKNDGSVNGKQYFSCADKHGTFAQPFVTRKL